MQMPDALEEKVPVKAVLRHISPACCSPLFTSAVWWIWFEQRSPLNAAPASHSVVNPASSLQEAKTDADEPAQMSILVEEVFNFVLFLFFFLYVWLPFPEHKADGWKQSAHSYDKWNSHHSTPVSWKEDTMLRCLDKWRHSPANRNITFSPFVFPFLFLSLLSVSERTDGSTQGPTKGLWQCLESYFEIVPCQVK